MRTSWVCKLIGCISLLWLLVGCQDMIGEMVNSEPEDVRNINITLVAKSSSNPVFLSARVGAEAAAKSLSEKYRKINVDIDWRTPKMEDPKEQAERIINAVNDGTDAIIVACSDVATITPAINTAVDSGVPVMTFDSDAPDSKRFAFYGPNDVEIGENVMDELATLMGKKGKVAILAGNQSAPNLQKRVSGVKNASSEYPDIEIVGVFQHVETAEDAAAEVIRVNALYPDLKGWAMVGGWPLFNETLLDKIDPGKIKIVAVDALPVQLPYVEKGIVPVLLAQPTFKWGKISVEKVIDKIHLGKDVPEMNEMQLIRVSKDNLGGWARQLKAWGYKDVPVKYLTYVAE